MGFTFDDQNLDKGSTPIAEMHRLIEQDPRNAERIFPYIGGEEVNNSPTHAHHRYVINFEDFPLQRNPNSRHPWHLLTEDTQKRMLRVGIVSAYYPDPVASDWCDLLAIVHEKVKPERGRQSRKALRERWWQYAEKRPGLYRTIEPLDRVLMILFTAPYLAVSSLLNDAVFANTLNIFAYQTSSSFCSLQSRVHEVAVAVDPLGGFSESLVRFTADFPENLARPAPQFILTDPQTQSGIADFASFGMTTDAAGNFYVATGVVGSSACGFQGSGPLVFLDRTLTQLFCVGLGAPIVPSTDVAVSPVDNLTYMTILGNPGLVVRLDPIVATQ